MKLTRYLLANILLLITINNIKACWDPSYSPAAYYMYRVSDPHTLNLNTLPTYKDNCKEWQKLSSNKISTEDIFHVVYKMPIREFENVYDNRNKKYDNKFIEWITKRDTTLLELLLVAKTTEYVRSQMSSPWFYSTMKIQSRLTLEEIINKSLTTKNKRLRDRYLLQGMRALFTLKKYEDCVKLWDNEISKLPKHNIMRQLCEDYASGARWQINRSKKSLEYFAQIGDIGSLLYCVNRDGEQLSEIEALAFLCKYNPNFENIPHTLQAYVRKLEPIGENGHKYIYTETEDTKKLYILCLEMGANPIVKNQAMWYYTAAFLADLKGDTQNATNFIALAGKSKSSQYIDESIAVFKMYIDAKTNTYNKDYEHKLFKQIQWLDKKISNNITEDVQNNTYNEYKLISGQSYYYWNDMLRRILIAEVCPRMIKSKNYVRALQLANMASNRLLNLVNKSNSYKYDKNRFNTLDYSNHFFEMIDSIGVQNVQNYILAVNKPSDDFDRYLNARGYTDKNYLYDIIGTQYLRNMQYPNAVKYLKMVNKSYDNHLNVSMKYDPFAIKNVRKKASKRFKYDFAKEMCELEKTMNSPTINPDSKAKAMFRFATGIHNSFNNCWELTQYYKGTYLWNQVIKKRRWENDKHTIAAITKAKSLFTLATETAIDLEIKANIQYNLCNFKTVATKYSETDKGQLVISACDNLRDYHIENKQPTVGDENPESGW